MNTVFLLLALASLCCIPVFLTLGLISVIRRKESKKRFKLAGISILALILSFTGFGFTLEEDANKKDSTIISTDTPSSTYALSESTPAESDSTVAGFSTSGTTEASTPETTEAPTTETAEAPTPETAEASTPETTEAPTTETAEAPTTENTETSTTQPINSDAKSVSSDTANTGSNNFNTHDNPEQQETTDTYVLNTSRKKIHYPNCRSVSQIAPENYSTSNESLDELKSQGYSTCGICFK